MENQPLSPTFTHFNVKTIKKLSTWQSFIPRYGLGLEGKKNKYMVNM
jgi:hypothetical protein